jgi:hypothetical protein
MKAFGREIQANRFVNGKHAGATEYRFVADDGKGSVLRVHKSGKIEMFGAASNEEWAELIEVMVEDRAGA